MGRLRVSRSGGAVAVGRGSHVSMLFISNSISMVNKHVDGPDHDGPDHGRECRVLIARCSGLRTVVSYSMLFRYFLPVFSGQPHVPTSCGPCRHVAMFVVLVVCQMAGLLAGLLAGLEAA